MPPTSQNENSNDFQSQNHTENNDRYSTLPPLPPTGESINESTGDFIDSSDSDDSNVDDNESETYSNEQANDLPYNGSNKRIKFSNGNDSFNIDAALPPSPKRNSTKCPDFEGSQESRAVDNIDEIADEDQDHVLITSSNEGTRLVIILINFVYSNRHDK